MITSYVFNAKQYNLFSNYSASYNSIKYVISDLRVTKIKNTNYLLQLGMSKIPLPTQIGNIVGFDFAGRFNCIPGQVICDSPHFNCLKLKQLLCNSCVTKICIPQLASGLSFCLQAILY
jgi:hypothetical protein